MKNNYKTLLCPTCKGMGIIERKEYTSNCPNASRHLYTDKCGKRVNYCVHCGKLKKKKLKSKEKNDQRFIGGLSEVFIYKMTKQKEIWTLIEIHNEFGNIADEPTFIIRSLGKTHSEIREIVEKLECKGETHGFRPKWIDAEELLKQLVGK